MILPKNAASAISDSLATARGGEGATPQHEEPMDEMEAMGHSILEAIHSKDAKGLAESLKAFQQAVSYSSDEDDESAEGSEPQEG